MNKDHMIVMKTLTDGTTKEIPLMVYIANKANDLRKLEDSFRKENKITKAYKEQEQAYLDYFQDTIKNWIRDSFQDDPEIIHKTAYYHQIVENFEVVVLVSKKDNK